jgi:oligopeptide transport system substrate-binding protein
MKSLLKTLSCALFALLFTHNAVAAKTHPVTGEALADEQVFTYNMGAEPPSIDPQLVEDVTGSAIARDLFEGLLTQNADGTLAPGVAERWETSGDKKTYTFYLRDNARWSNGDPVTAHDFVYAWRRAVDPRLASPYSGYMRLMSIENAAEIIEGKKPIEQLGVKALDDHTFQVRLSDPLPYFPTMVVHTTTMPTHRATIEKFGDKWTRPGNMVSNGAYVLTEHVLNERLVRERNPQYWNNANTIIDKVVALVINDENQAFNRYQAGELDMAAVPTGQYKRLKKKMPDEVYSVPRLCSYYYALNVEKKPLDDVRVRKALAYAVNRDIITRNILQAGQIPAYTFTPGATANFDVPEVPFAKMTQKERDSKARELLAEAGFDKNNPLEVTILYNTSEGHKKIAIAISQMWKRALGVRTTLENQEWKTFLNTRDVGDFQIARAAWCGDYNEASTFLELMMSNSEYNDSNYKNPEVDRLMQESKTLDDPNPNYTRVEQIIAEDFPIIPIYHYTNTFLLKPYLKGWPFDNVENNWYSRNLYVVKH